MSAVAAAAPAPVPGYTGVARFLHWLIASLTVIAVGFGLAIPQAPHNTHSRELLLLLHRSIGLTILGLMVARALWRTGHPPPHLPVTLRRMQVGLARATHAALYLLLIGMPITGYLNAAAAGLPVSFFGIAAIPPLIAENDRLSQIAIALHLAGQYLVYLLVLLHTAAALHHGIVRRDGVLELMLPPRRRGGASGQI
ncbi:MAG TPA: cytochrome b [Stellaceae bacterium]|nr:cytochrome b [Stellaceae bacterium]